MNILNHIKNNTISLKVIPNSSRTQLIEEDGKLKLYLKSVPEKNKANQELIRFFRKEFGLRVGVISGATSRKKLLGVIK